MRTVHGPKGYNASFVVDDVTYTATDGVFNPPLTADKVPDNVWGMGVVVDTGEAAEEPAADA